MIAVRRSVAYALGVLFVVACGAREERLADRHDERTRGQETTTTPPHAGCPASFSDPGPTCQGSDVVVTGCTYPEGSCSCGTSAWCGGAARPPRPMEWICRPTRPPCASDGTPCDTPGASCALDDCGFVGVRCAEGTWRAYNGPYPP